MLQLGSSIFKPFISTNAYILNYQNYSKFINLFLKFSLLNKFFLISVLFELRVSHIFASDMKACMTSNNNHFVNPISQGYHTSYYKYSDSTSCTDKGDYDAYSCISIGQIPIDLTVI